MGEALPSADEGYDPQVETFRVDLGGEHFSVITRVRRARRPGASALNGAGIWRPNGSDAWNHDADGGTDEVT